MGDSDTVGRFCFLDGRCVTIYAQGTLTVDDLDEAGHPNVAPFKGTLLRIGQASDMPPQGAQGHRILVPMASAKKELDTLVGMGVNYRADGHQPQKKIGVITGAWIDGNAVKVKGILYAKDFADEVKEIRANAPRLGMSMELADVWISDRDADVWTLDSFAFTGAAILAKQAAAYHKTSLVASACTTKAVQRGIYAGIKRARKELESKKTRHVKS